VLAVEVVQFTVSVVVLLVAIFIAPSPLVSGVTVQTGLAARVRGIVIVNDVTAVEPQDWSPVIVAPVPQPDGRDPSII
jgi:hypothetical protein